MHEITVRQFFNLMRKVDEQCIFLRWYKKWKYCLRFHHLLKYRKKSRQNALMCDEPNSHTRLQTTHSVEFHLSIHRWEPRRWTHSNSPYPKKIVSLVTYLLFKGDEISDCTFIFCTTFKKYTVHHLISLDWKADGLWFHAFIWGLNDEI